MIRIASGDEWGIALYNMNEIWEYQRLDIKADKFELDLKASKDYQQFAKLYQYIDEQSKILGRITKSSDDKLAQIDRQEERQKLLFERFNDAKTKYELVDKNDLEQVKRFLEYYENLRKRVAKDRKDFSQILESLEKEEEQLNIMKTNVSQAAKEYEEVKKRLYEKRKEFAPEVEKLRAEADELAKSLDKNLLKAYNKAKKSHDVPIAKVEDGRCTGCNMELSTSLLRKLRDAKEICECENCGRILMLGEE